MNILYACPSYKRAKTIEASRWLKKCIIYVGAFEYNDYVTSGRCEKENVYAVPDGVQGNGKGHCLNWMLDNVWQDDTDALVIVDDDMRCMMRHVSGGKDEKLTEDEFYEMVEHYSLLAKEWGCGLWSVNINGDPLIYETAKPFRLHAYLDGQFTVIVRNPPDIRYDEELTVKEDVDFALQHMQKYHKALRVDRYYPKVGGFNQVGGVGEFRNKEIEQEQFRMLQKKWGSNVIRPNRPNAKKLSEIRSLGGAVKINVPLEGC